MTATTSTIHLCFAYVWQSQPEWEKERERGGKRGRGSMLCVPHFKANRNRSSGICCIVWAPLRRCLCVLFAYPITKQQCEAGTGQEREGGVGRGGGAAVASQMLILIKINALGHVEVEKLARLTFFVAFSICLAFAWPLSGVLYPSTTSPSPVSSPLLSEY